MPLNEPLTARMLRLLNNKVVLFVLSRYFSYVIQFVNSLVVAYVLGPYYLGIWGFVLLVIQYLNFGNFGIDIALNVNLSTGDLADRKKQSAIASNAVLATLFTCLIYVLAAAAIPLAGVELFPKYGFTPFLVPVLIITCLNYFNVLFLNICRTYSLFAPISIFQTLLQAIQLPVMFIFRDIELVWALLAAMVIAHGVSGIIYLRYLPFKLQLALDKTIVKQLFGRGIRLLSYAVTFYILLLSTRSMVGYFYPVEVMGLFTFAANIAAALIVGLSSLEFVLFPKMINRLSADELSESMLGTFRDVRFIYMASAFLVVTCGLLFYPVILYFFKDYAATTRVFAFLALSQIILSSGFGYSTLIISRQKEIYLIIHGLVALVINLAFSVFCRLVFGIGYETMALLLLLAFAWYDYHVIKLGRQLLRLPGGFMNIARDLVPLRSIPALVMIALALVTGMNTLFYALAVLAFVIFNAKNYKVVKQYVQTLFHRPTVINIQQE